MPPSTLKAAFEAESGRSPDRYPTAEVDPKRSPAGCADIGSPPQKQTFVALDEADCDSRGYALLRHVVDRDGLTQPLERQIADFFQLYHVLDGNSGATGNQDLTVLGLSA